MKFLITVVFLLISLIYGSSAEIGLSPSKRSAWQGGAKNDPARTNELRQQHDDIMCRVRPEGIRSIVTDDSNASLFLQIVDTYKKLDHGILRKHFDVVRLKDCGFSYEKTTDDELKALFTVDNVKTYILNNKSKLTCSQCVNLLFFADGSTSRDLEKCEARINLTKEFLKSLFPSEAEISIRNRYLKLLEEKFPEKLHLITETPSTSPIPQHASPQEDDGDYPMVPVVSSMPKPTRLQATDGDYTGIPIVSSMPQPTQLQATGVDYTRDPRILSMQEYLGNYSPYADPRIPVMPGHLTHGHYPMHRGVSPMHHHVLPMHHHVLPMHHHAGYFDYQPGFPGISALSHHQPASYHPDALLIPQYPSSYSPYAEYADPRISVTPSHLTHGHYPMGHGISPMHYHASPTHHHAGYTGYRPDFDALYHATGYQPVIPHTDVYDHDPSFGAAPYPASSIPAGPPLLIHKRPVYRFASSKFESDGKKAKTS